MRILHVHKYYHNHDGAGRYMFDVMRMQEEAGHVVAPFAMHDPRNAPSAWDKYFVSSLDTSRVGFGLDGIRQLVRAFWCREAEQKMRRLLAVFKPDIVHIHNLYTHLSPSVLAPCKQAGIPVVMTVHDYALVSANYGLWDGAQAMRAEQLSWLKVARTRFIKGSFFATFLLEGVYRLQRAFRFYDRAIYAYLPSSQYVADALLAVGYPKDKIHILSLFSGNLLSGMELPETHGQRSGVLYAGRLEDYKGIDLVLKAAQAFPKIDFLIAGTGPNEAEVREEARHLENVQYLGFLPGEALWQQMADAQLVLVPSRWPEPYGLVAIEAMACGTPVMVSDAGGLPEKIKDGVNGVVFKAGDVQDLTAKLKSVFKHPKDLERMGEGAFRYAKAQADPRKHLDRLMEIYASQVIHK